VRIRVVPGETRGGSVATREASERDAKRAEALRAVRGDQFVDDLVTMLDAKVLDQSVQPTPKNG